VYHPVLLKGLVLLGLFFKIMSMGQLGTAL